MFAGSLIWEYLGGIDLEKDREFSTFIMNYIPAGIKSIILIGVLSAAMSTLSSSINSLASSTAIDIFKGKVSLNMSRLISLFWALILIIIAIVFDESDTAIVIVGLKIASFTYGGLLGIFLISFINDKIDSNHIIVGLITSILIVFYLSTTNIAWVFYILISLITFIITCHLAYYFDLIINKQAIENPVEKILYVFLWIIMSMPLYLILYKMLLLITNIADVLSVIIFIIMSIPLCLNLYVEMNDE